MLKKKKMMSLLVMTMLLVGAFGFSSYGASVSKTLQAWYGTSRIIVDGKDVTATIEPFIVDGTTYIPLRVVANTFNKKVDWNPTTSTANITDDLTQVDNYYQTEILKRDVEIMNLKNEVQKLKKELEDNKVMDLDDLEDVLNDEFDEYRGIEFEISLSGKPSDVEVEIEVDLDDYEDEWKGLSASRKQSYLQDIVDEILEAYPDADIEGSVIDTDKKKTVLLEFTVDKKGAVKIGNSDMDLDDLEEELDDRYYDYFKNIKVSIVLEGDEDEITFYVDIDYDKYEDEWDKLTKTQIKNFMADIYDDIADEFEDADIEGIVWDTANNEELYAY